MNPGKPVHLGSCCAPPPAAPGASFIDPAAKIDPSVRIGRFCVVGAGVTIGAGTVVGHHAVIHDGTTIGAECRIDDGAVIGKRPMRAATSILKETGELPGAVIGDRVMVGAHAVIYAGCAIGERCLVADLATVREKVTVGAYTIVGRGVAIENECAIGSRVKLETNAYITAYSTVEDGCFVAPCVCTTNDAYMGRSKERFGKFRGVTLKRGARVGANATILPGLSFAPDGQAGAGAVVTRDVPAGKTVVGVPAKPFRDVPEAELLDNQ